MAAAKRRKALQAAKATAGKATNQRNAGFKFPAGNASYRKAAVSTYRKTGNLEAANAAGVKARGASYNKAGKANQVSASGS